jgi:hypothetical protein
LTLSFVLRELSVVEQRYQAVLAVIRDGHSVVEMAARWTVARQAVAVGPPGNPGGRSAGPRRPLDRSGSHVREPGWDRQRTHRGAGPMKIRVRKESARTTKSPS